MLLNSCAHVQSMPEEPMVKVAFPQEHAYLGKPERPYEIIDVVRAKVNFPTMDLDQDMKQLCQNYFNKAVYDMVQQGKRLGADAVIHVKSVTYLFNGEKEEFSGPECADSGAEGQVLTKALAVRWRKPKASRYR